MSTCMPMVIALQLAKTLSLFGAVLIDGPKWCGKTTTASQQAASAISLTDPAGGFASHYHDAEDLEANAIVWKRSGDWIPIEIKLGSAQVPFAAESLLRLE